MGLVPTPIPRLAEEWLLDRLPHNLSTTAGAIICSAMADFGWDGRHAARLRADPSRTFELATPLVRDDGSPLALRLTSDQAFDMALGAAHVRRAHTLLVSLAFGVIPHNTPPDRLGLLFRERSDLWTYLERTKLPTASEDAVVGPLGDVVRAVAMAAALEVELLVK